MRTYIYEITTKHTVNHPDGVPQDAIMIEVGGRECVGRCETCSIPIADNDEYYFWQEQVLTCKTCSGPAEIKCN